MARLTNRQMEVLSERVTDLLQEAHENQFGVIEKTPEYINFEKTYTDENLELLRPLKERAELIAEMESKLEFDVTKFLDSHTDTFYSSAWGSAASKVEKAWKGYLQKAKDATFEIKRFDRDKTLRRVQADILLSDVSNPDELVKSLVEKLK